MPTGSFTNEAEEWPEGPHDLAELGGSDEPSPAMIDADTLHFGDVGRPVFRSDA